MGVVQSKIFEPRELIEYLQEMYECSCEYRTAASLVQAKELLDEEPQRWTDLAAVIVDFKSCSESVPLEGTGGSRPIPSLLPFKDVARWPDRLPLIIGITEHETLMRAFGCDHIFEPDKLKFMLGSLLGLRLRQRP